MLHSTIINTLDDDTSIDTINLDHATEALESLDAELRQSIHLAYYARFSNKQVADLLGVSVETAEERLVTGLSSLREALASAA